MMLHFTGTGKPRRVIQQLAGATAIFLSYYLAWLCLKRKIASEEPSEAIRIGFVFPIVSHISLSYPCHFDSIPLSNVPLSLLAHFSQAF